MSGGGGVSPAPPDDSPTSKSPVVSRVSKGLLRVRTHFRLLRPGRMFKLDSDKISKTQYTSVMSIESFDGLNSGVPTRTTATLTPTTLRNIEQTFQECQAETHQNQARFVPPLVQPSSQVLHKSGSFMSVVDTKSWQGGRITESPHNIPVDMLTTSIITQPRRNVGGRRPIKDKSISPEEEERRAVRRERNKLAAARCRKRRLDHTNELVMETEGLQDKKKGLENELAQLKIQKQELEFLLDNHRPCKLNKEIKSEELSEESAQDHLGCGKENEIDNIPKITHLKKNIGKRPTTLSVHSYLPTTSLDGVPLTTPTPTNGIFNFESIMEGGTGLTPVSGPLVPSCSTQQRNIGNDLSSPDSGKLVSL